MSYYADPESHIGDKVDVVLDLWNYVTKKELKDATFVGVPDLAAKRDIIVLKAEVEKLDINMLIFQLVWTI